MSRKNAIIVGSSYCICSNYVQVAHKVRISNRFSNHNVSISLCHKKRSDFVNTCKCSR